MRRIRKRARAEQDLIEIWLYTCSRWGEAQAELYFDHLDEGIRRIRRDPELGRRCDWIREGYRSIQVNRHVVYYTVTPSVVNIVRVLHERMDPSPHFTDQAANGGEVDAPD